MSRLDKKRSALLLLSLAAVLASSPTAGAQDQQRRVAETSRSAFPALNMGIRQAAGQAAVEHLGSNLTSIAAWYGKSATQLRRELLADRRMRVDSAGRLLAVEEIDTPVFAAQASPAQGAIQDGALANLDQTFALHSRPGSQRTIYLDFDGATIANTAWNSNGNIITAQPYDFDGSPGSFSTAEQQRIQYIWQRVAEDYAPFDVDVTTEVPVADALTRARSADQAYGTTVVITRTDGVYSCTCGGIAYVGVFNYFGGNNPPDYYKPAFVFYNMLGAGAEKAVAEAISHEAGHNIGLHHDGIPTASYYGGQGTDVTTGWAPIMGVGYYKPLVQFSRGEYNGANNTEDDFAVAQSFGLPLRSDDYANAAITSSPMQLSTANGIVNASVDGIIESFSDRDVFAVASGPGLINVSVTPASRSGNADLAVSLVDAAGTTLASANPPNSLAANLAFKVPVQGSYYVEVSAGGQDDPATDGYSSYGSVGNYRVTASYVAPVGSAPVAAVSTNTSAGIAPLAVKLDGTQSIDDGHVAFWYWDFGDGSGDRTGSLSSVSHTYLVPGTYTARLVVIDDSGLSSAATQTVVVENPAAQASIQVLDMQIKSKRGGVSAAAVVNIVDQNGRPVKGAAVSVAWSGAVSKSTSKKTARTGIAVLASPMSKTGGCFILTVTGVTSSTNSFTNSRLPTAQVCS